LAKVSFNACYLIYNDFSPLYKVQNITITFLELEGYNTRTVKLQIYHLSAIHETLKLAKKVHNRFFDNLFILSIFGANYGLQ